MEKLNEQQANQSIDKRSEINLRVSNPSDFSGKTGETFGSPVFPDDILLLYQIFSLQ